MWCFERKNQDIGVLKCVKYIMVESKYPNSKIHLHVACARKNACSCFMYADKIRL